MICKGAPVASLLLRPQLTSSGLSFEMLFLFVFALSITSSKNPVCAFVSSTAPTKSSTMASAHERPVRKPIHSWKPMWPPRAV